MSTLRGCCFPMSETPDPKEFETKSIDFEMNLKGNQLILKGILRKLIDFERKPIDFLRNLKGHQVSVKAI